jgi:hypothetical protein
MSREIHYCKCGQSIFGDMTDCGDCPESVDSVVVGVDPGTDKSAFAIFDGREVISHGIYENEHFLSHGLWSRRHVFCEMIASPTAWLLVRQCLRRASGSVALCRRPASAAAT